MIRDIVSNDLLTVILFSSLLIIIILKKIDYNSFSLYNSLIKRELRNKLGKNYTSLKITDIFYKILFISNLSILLCFYEMKKFDDIIYLKFLKYISLFFVIKFFTEIIIAQLFSIQKVVRNYLWSKLIYRNSLGFLILIFNFLIVYAENNNQFIPILSTIILLCFLISYFVIFFSMKKVIIKNWFYFILYLCTLEIIPYYYLISNVL